MSDVRDNLAILLDELEPSDEARDLAADVDTLCVDIARVYQLPLAAVRAAMARLFREEAERD